MGKKSRRAGRGGAVTAVARASETRDIGPTVSINDPAIAAWLGLSPSLGAEASALSIPTYWRCVQIITGTIAGLPLKTYEEQDGGRVRVSSWIDEPAGPYARGGITPFTWKKWVLGHMVTRGESFLQHVYNGGGGLIGLLPVPPQNVTPKWNSTGGKDFDVQRSPSPAHYDSSTMTQIMGHTIDGLRGESPVSLFRQTLLTTVAGETAAAQSFKGALISGLVSADEDIEAEDAIAIKAGLDAKLNGVDNTNQVAFVNRKLKFTPWTMSAEDAQFIESRSFQVEEWARIFGVPTSLLSVSGAVSNWGTGVAEANVGLQRFTLRNWSTPLEEALSALLPEGQWCEFDYSGLLQGTPGDEIQLLIQQVQAGILTADEARAIRNMPGLPAPEGER